MDFKNFFIFYFCLFFSEQEKDIFSFEDLNECLQKLAVVSQGTATLES